ncbi:MAG: hypothetical protein A2Z20_04525, partial [Bdellovibrionales bacterium RBG_16_40_8]
HPPDWAVGKNHGVNFFKDRNTCLGCHDTSRADQKSPRCQTCHEFPHAAGWAIAKNHGAAYVAGQPYSNPAKNVMCQHCHDNTSSEVSKIAPSCETCHTKIPHDDAFKYGGHKSQATTYQGKCLICHLDYKKNMPTVGQCTLCHQGVIKIHWDQSSTTSFLDISPFMPIFRIPAGNSKPDMIKKNKSEVKKNKSN